MNFRHKIFHWKKGLNRKHKMVKVFSFLFSFQFMQESTCGTRVENLDKTKNQRIKNYVNLVYMILLEGFCLIIETFVISEVKTDCKISLITIINHLNHNFALKCDWRKIENVSFRLSLQITILMKHILYISLWQYLVSWVFLKKEQNTFT